MNHIARSAIVVLLLLGLAMAGTTPAQAQTQPLPEALPNAEILLSKMSAVPSQATGKAELTNLFYWGYTWWYFDDPDWGWTCSEDYSATLTVRCEKLQPHTKYLVSFNMLQGYFTTDRNGLLTAELPVSFAFAWWYESGKLVTSGPDFPVQVRVSGKAGKVGLFYGEKVFADFHGDRADPPPPPSN